LSSNNVIGGDVDAKSLSRAIALLLTVSAAGFSQQPSDRQLCGLHGKVRTQRDESVSYSDKSGQWVAGPRKLEALTTFSPEGKILEDLRFREDGTWVSFTTENPNLRIAIVHKADGAADRKTVTTTSQDGQLTTEISYSSDGSIRQKEIWRRDSSGRLLELSTWAGDGTPTGKYVPSYSKDGKETGNTMYDGKGAVTSSVRVISGLAQAEIENFLADSSKGKPGETVTIDTKTADGKMTESVHYGKDGMADYRTFYTYDLRGVNVDSSTYDAKGAKIAGTRHSEELDSNGNMIKTVFEKWVPDGDGGHYVPLEHLLSHHRNVLK